MSGRGGIWTFRRARRIAAWLGLFAILAQAMLPVLHYRPVEHGVFKVLARADAGPLTAVICTPSGFKVVTLDGLPAEDGSQQKNGKTRFCPLCQAANAVAALVPPVAPTLDVLETETRIALTVAYEALARRPATANLQPRAPPFPIG